MGGTKRPPPAVASTSHVERNSRSSSMDKEKRRRHPRNSWQSHLDCETSLVYERSFGGLFRVVLPPFLHQGQARLSIKLTGHCEALRQWLPFHEAYELD